MAFQISADMIMQAQDHRFGVDRSCRCKYTPREAVRARAAASSHFADISAPLHFLLINKVACPQIPLSLDIPPGTQIHTHARAETEGRNALTVFWIHASKNNKTNLFVHSLDGVDALRYHTSQLIDGSYASFLP